MARKRRGPRRPPSGVHGPPSSCEHSTIYITPSPYAYTNDSGLKLMGEAGPHAAGTPGSRISAGAVPSTPTSTLAYSSTFPKPLALPGHKLVKNEQSVQEWAEFMKRQQPTAKGKRHKLYVAGPPSFGHGASSYMRGWERPQLEENQKNPHNWPPHDLNSLGIDHHVRYLRAYFHGMEVEKISGAWEWIRWDPNEDDEQPRKKIKLRAPPITMPTLTPCYIGLRHRPSGKVHHVCHYPSPDKLSRQQLSLTDVLHAMKAHMPGDGDGVCITSLMFLEHDISYTDTGNVLCIGRASRDHRVSVVSEFRDRPELETFYGRLGPWHREHCRWPRSHCSMYVENMCAKAHNRGASSLRNNTAGNSSVSLGTPPVRLNRTSPLGAAIKAASCRPSAPHTFAQWQAAFFWSVATTVTHEVGHCMGLEHCLHYACVMQPAGTPAEAPYLCPLCLEKMSLRFSHLIQGAGRSGQAGEGGQTSRVGQQTTLSLQRRWIKERYQALAHVCQSYGRNSVFVAWDAWLNKRLEQLDQEWK